MNAFLEASQIQWWSYKKTGNTNIIIKLSKIKKGHGRLSKYFQKNLLSYKNNIFIHFTMMVFRQSKWQYNTTIVLKLLLGIYLCP